MTTSRGTQHAGSGAAPTDQPPEPSFAERARTLLHVGRVGTLSTHSRKASGHPFGSVAPYGVDEAGQPTFLFSTMAMHTQNLLADARASLLVTQPGETDDPLAGARVTLVGAVATIAPPDVAAVRAAYLARHPTARHWVDFDDFAFYRLAVADLYYVAGFGAMGWVDAVAYRDAQPDPLADNAPTIVAHMNADHADALVVYCKVLGGIDADAATMTAVDRLGFRMRAQTGEGLRGVRINFPREVRSAEETRVVLVEMLRECRAAG